MTLKVSRKGAKAQRDLLSSPCAFAPLRETFLLALLLFSCFPVQAQPSVSYAPPEDESANFQTQVLLADLDNPTGLALRPMQAKGGPYELLFSESGAGRVVRVATNSPERLEEVIVNFPLGTFGQQPEYRVGPQGLAFISRTKLVVGFKGDSSGADLLASYALSSGGAALNATEYDHVVGPLNPKLASQVDDLQFCGLAMAEQTLYITSGGQDSQGWVLKLGLEANRLAALQAFIKLQKKVGYGAPAGIAVIPHPRPAFLVVGLMGSREIPRDSRLAFFVPSTGELALDLPTGLHDIISLAYSPSGQLYAADFSWQDEQAGGVYRIDDARHDLRNGGQPTCRAVKIASIVRPVSLAFAPNGSLFVTALGPGENTKQGSIVKITGKL